MIKNWFEIDGETFDVTVLSIQEKAAVLYSDKTGRTIAPGAPMTLDPLGTFYNYSVTVKRNGDNLADYDRLFMKVTEPRYNGFTIKAVHNQSAWEFNGYISAAEREVKRIDKNGKKVYWKEMQLTITAMKAQVLPV